MLSTSTIDQVRSLPIEQVIGKYVTLKPAGSGKLKACCPIHNEKTPSLIVTPNKEMFHCFGCGVGGDAIQFVMEVESLPFYEAIKIIANDNGIAIEETETAGKTPEQKNDEASMLEWVQKTQKQYRTNLIERESVIRYLYNRNITRNTIIEWQFGVCPDWQSITTAVQTSGHTKIAEACGLVKTSGNGRTYDFMHHRLTIPIHDTQGKLIGFGGRLYSTTDQYGKPIEGAKYINPPDSPLYDKSKLLFGLHKARKHFKTHGMAVLVEGYFDVIKMHQQGWNNAVATCGTALTEAQAKHLKRFTDTVLILRDGDNAGNKAIKKDIPILLAQQFTVYMCELSGKEDPDTLFDKPFEAIVKVLSNYNDGLEYLAGKFLADGATSATNAAYAIEKIVELLSLITNQVRREQYIKAICTKFKGLNGAKLKEADFTKPLAKLLQQREDERAEAERAHDDEYEALPKWVDRKRLEVDGFVQLHNDTNGYKAGIYFLNVKNRNLYRVTNFVIKPLYHIYDQSNNRRLVEIDNTHRNSVVELPTQSFINQGNFEAELMNKGNYMCYEFLARSEFKRIIGWMVNSMPIAYELKTLGWQPEGFFAFSNAVYADGNLIQYDELGMIKVEDKHYMSLGNSKIHRDERQIDNPYENDLYLKHVSPRDTINFQKWSHLFFDSYGENAPFGIAFAFLTLFKDVVTRITKMPLLYCYGQKGSGKSSMAESITWLFFSGKDAEGNLMRGFNLNPGQSTPFSFFNRVERFRNCPILMNEFDENTIESWKTGTMKAAYDGEGREVGDGSTGKAKKTKMQKVQGTIMLVGQYLATKDDAAVSSRSIPCNFSLERLKNLTKEQIKSFTTLQLEEREGLSGTLTELLTHRSEVQKSLRKNFIEIQNKVMDEMRKSGYRIESRLISNYSIMLAATKSLTDLGIQLPYTFDTFYEKAVERMIKHNQTLKDSSIVNQFWKSLEVLFDKGIITNGNQINVTRFPTGINIKEGSKVTRNEELKSCELLLVRFSNVYSEYAKYHRDRTGQAAQSEENLLMYLKEQTYFVGLTPSESFSDKRTSAHVFNYSAMKDLGIGLKKQNHHEADNDSSTPEEKEETETVPALGTQDDLPF